MKLFDLLQNITILNTKNISQEMDISFVTSRSYQVKENTAFICLQGLHHNGADFAKEAIEKGASVILSETPLEENVPQIIVSDAREALAKMCDNLAGNPCKSMTVIGVTGTNGKTSTVHFLEHLFRTSGKKVAICSTVGDKIGTQSFGASGMTTQDPEELYPRLRTIADAGTEYLFLEVSSHALAQKKVAPIRFAMGVITNLSQDHLDFHKTMENYAEAKGTLLSLCGCAIIPHESAYTSLWKKMAKCPIFTYAVDCDSADFTAKNCRFRNGGITFEFLAKETIFRIASPILGNFTYDNALLACAVATIFSLPREGIIHAMETMPQVPGRMERLSLPQGIDFSVYLDYAHTPDALKRALTSLQDITSNGKRWVIFGCGGDRDAGKRSPMGQIAMQYADYAIVTEDNCRTEDAIDIFSDILEKIPKNAEPILIRSRADAIFYAITHAKSGDILLFAGKGHENYEIGKDGKHPFSERDLIESACKIKLMQKNCKE